MKFSLISDMHVNHPQLKTPYDKLEELVIVAGDTSNGLEGLKFLQKLRNKGHRVIAVDGNHENYNNLSQARSIEETTARFREHFPCKVEVDGILFIQRNGWYVVEHEVLWQNYMSDMKYCRTSAEEVNKRAAADAWCIKQELQSARDYQHKVVVTTHTAPCPDTLNPQFDGHYSNDWYWNPYMRPLLAKFKDTILVWCHGHTHAFADKSVDGVRVVANPRGYPGENPDWQPFTIEV